MGLIEAWISSLVILEDGIGLLRDTLPIWGALIALYAFWQYWVIYVRTDFIQKQEHVVLEIRLPKDIQKTPLAMEVFLNSLHQTSGEKDLKEKYWQGSIRPWFSLEIVSVEGQIRFFMWMRKEWRKLIESQVYAQYPNVEIVPVPDYAEGLPLNPDTYSVGGTEFKLTKEDPYPIKTYIDYALDREPTEEYKTDPMAPLLEFMGSVGPGEHVWLQVLVRAHKDKVKGLGFFGPVMTDWQEEGEEILKELLEEEGDDDDKRRKRLSPGENRTVEAVERSLTKLPFDCGIRAVYLAESERFDKMNVAGLTGAFKQYNSNDLNGFEPTNKSDKFDIIEAYRLRSYFHEPYKRKPFILSGEELATIYHLPGENVETPTFQRVPSKKAEPPTNLPT